MIAAAAVIFFAVYWFMAGYTGGGSGQYPSLVKGNVYTGHELTADGNSVSIPADYLDEKKLVFLDVKLEQPTEELLYLGRRIPLSSYRGGEYLPLVLISTRARAMRVLQLPPNRQEVPRLRRLRNQMGH